MNKADRCGLGQEDPTIRSFFPIRKALGDRELLRRTWRSLEKGVRPPYAPEELTWITLALDGKTRAAAYHILVARGDLDTRFMSLHNFYQRAKPLWALFFCPPHNTS